MIRPHDTAVPEHDRAQTASPDRRFRIVRTDDGSRTLVDVATGDAFHSESGAAAETNHVYLGNSCVAERLLRGIPTRVLEVGFGIGMGFVLTAAEALRCRVPLQYMALENQLPDAATLAAVWAPEDPSWSNDQREIVQQLIAWRTRHPGEMAGTQKITIGDCQLRLVITDALLWRADGSEAFDAVYFDPFGPNSTPRLWESEVLRQMFEALVEGGRLVSYCVNRTVRARLEEVGFSVRRAAGPPGGKREVLIAERLSGRSKCALP